MTSLKLALALGAMLLPVTAANADTDYRVRVGLGAQVNPEFPGAKDLDVGPYFKFSVARRDKPFSFGAPDDSFGISLLSSGGFSAGPVLNLKGARNDSDVGAPVGDVKRTVEVGAFVQHYVSDNFRVRAEARQGLGGHGGLLGYVGADYVARLADKWAISIGPRVRFGSSDYLDAYYGVTPQVALLTGLPVHDPDAGVRAVGAISGFNYALDDRWGLFGYGRYDRLVGDARKSPIVREFGSPNQFSAGLGVSYTFNINL